MIKDTMKRKKPSFDESYYGYRSFTHLLEEADNAAVVDIERNPKSGTYVVTRFYGERAPAEPRRVHASDVAVGRSSRGLSAITRSQSAAAARGSPRSS